MKMKTLLLIGCLLFVSGAYSADCVTNARGKVICGNGTKAVAVNPNTGTVTTAQKNAAGGTTVQSSTGSKAAYNPNTGNVTTSQKNAAGGTTVRSSTGAKAAHNPNTGNTAVSQQNANGVTTTQTSRGGKAKTKNGKGVVQGPGGTTCARGANASGCTR